MILTFILGVLCGFLLCGMLYKRKTAAQKPPENADVGNAYINRHEKKLTDDDEYEEYLKWCRTKGEIPEPKEGFDRHRAEEYQLYKKLMKNGISGLF